MSLQARMSPNDERLYNVNRDVAHNFGDVVREVAARLEDGRWAILEEIMTRYAVTPAQLGDACAAFCEFVAGAMDRAPYESMVDALQRSGWNDVRQVAQVAYMAYLGTVMAGYFYAGVHEATLGGKGPCLTYQDLRESGRRSAILIRRPRWRRALLRWRRQVLAAIGSLFRRRPKP